MVLLLPLLRRYFLSSILDKLIEVDLLEQMMSAIVYKQSGVYKSKINHWI